ncbi:MAG TPA: serine hydrolase [Gemmatimonadales bacterium]|nr:serine hydrolase [Gemmatimonadales bacterium]
MGHSVRASLLLSAGLVIGAPGLEARQQPLAGFDAYVARAVADWRVPGLAIVVVKDDSVAFIKGYGVRELGKPEPVTVHTRFGVMSTTKAFTTMLLAMLADSGKVAWDDPATKYLPGLEFQDPYVTREVRLRDLVTHRIGFGDPEYLWAYGSFDLLGMVRRLRLVPATSSLRSRFAYNNVAYALAGDVAGRAGGAGGAGGGTTWQAQLRKRIYEPLGMTESYPDAREMQAAGISDVSSPHGIVHDTVRVLPVPAAIVDPVAPAGAMFSSVTDEAKWLRFLLDTARVGGKRLLSARAFAELFTPQQVVPPEEFYPTARLTHPHYTAYGLGWFLEDYRGEFVAFHTGSIEGRSAIVGLIPDRRLGVAIFTNLDHSELRHALMYTVFDRYQDGGPVARGGRGAGGAGHDWSAEMRTLYRALQDTAETRRKEREGKRIANTHPTLPTERYAADYADSLFGGASVRQEGDRLTLRVGTLVGDLEHWQYDIFRANWRDQFQGSDYVAFTLDPDGSVGELRLVGGPLRFRRVRTASP